MASERDVVLQSVVPDDREPEVNLDKALLEAEHTKQLSLQQEHEIKKLRAQLGWFGVVFGGEAHASIVIAFVVVVLGFAGAIGLWIVAYRAARPEFWASEAHVSLAAATSALGYVFGRGSRDNTKS